MVVVAPTVEPDELKAQEFLDLYGSGVDHLNNVIRALLLPADNEEVGEHLDVEEDQLVHRGWLRSNDLRALIRLEFHLRHKAQAVLRLVGTVQREGEDPRTEFGHVIRHARLVRIVEDLVDEVNAGLGAGMDLLLQVALDEISDTPFVLHGVTVDHFLLLDWQSR